MSVTVSYQHRRRGRSWRVNANPAISRAATGRETLAQQCPFRARIELGIMCFFF